MKQLADLLGESPGINAIRDKVVRLLARQQDARRLPPVLIEGETGTGKGLLARLIHRSGPRPQGPFVDVNCAAIPETLLEAEMFGFERGAFTDARRAKPGLFQAANRGTIFLDEVALLSEGLQAKLLKVLEERSVRRLGSTRDEPIDVWILTATNEDLKAAIPARRFREDLYHRLAVLTLTLPPLRSRGDDILLLAEHYLGRACADYSVSAKTLSADARAALRAYPWPGNVRELANLMERVALLSSEPEVTADALGLSPVAPRGAVGAGSGRRSELARRRRARPCRRGPAPDELEHLSYRFPPRHLAQHPARPDREVRSPVRRGVRAGAGPARDVAGAPAGVSTAGCAASGKGPGAAAGRGFAGPDRRPARPVAAPVGAPAHHDAACGAGHPLGARVSS